MLRVPRSAFKFTSLLRFSNSRPSSTAAPIASDKSNAVESKSHHLSHSTPVFKRALLFENAIALKDQNGEFSYQELVSGSTKLANQISELCGKKQRNSI